MEMENELAHSGRGWREEAEARVHVNFEPFELQPSIIDVVSDLCPEHEAEEIWHVVGYSLVEQARDLLKEARLLLEVWRQLKDDADHATLHNISKALPEPPMVRERLIQEIRFLADHLRDKARSPTHTSERSREILDYALSSTDHHGSGHGSGCGRPQSAVSSRDGRDTPLRRSTPSSMDGSQSSLQSGRVSVEHVSLANIDSTVEYLREVLEEEIAQRKEDIMFLHDCSEGESSHLQETHSAPPPSLRELRESKGLLPRPPPVKCSAGSQMPSASVRRASGVKPRLQLMPPNVQDKPPSTQTHGIQGLIRDHHSVESKMFSTSRRFPDSAIYASPTSGELIT